MTTEKNKRYELVCQCNKCGRWSALLTTNISKATFKCKCCGRSIKIRYSGGWNINVSFVRDGETLAEAVMRKNEV